MLIMSTYQQRHQHKTKGKDVFWTKTHIDAILATPEQGDDVASQVRALSPAFHLTLVLVGVSVLSAHGLVDARTDARVGVSGALAVMRLADVPVSKARMRTISGSDGQNSSFKIALR